MSFITREVFMPALFWNNKAAMARVSLGFTPAICKVKTVSGPRRHLTPWAHLVRLKKTTKCAQWIRLNTHRGTRKEHTHQLFCRNLEFASRSCCSPSSPAVSAARPRPGRRSLQRSPAAHIRENIQWRPHTERLYDMRARHFYGSFSTMENMKKNNNNSRLTRGSDDGHLTLKLFSQEEVTVLLQGLSTCLSTTGHMLVWRRKYFPFLKQHQ